MLKRLSLFIVLCMVLGLGTYTIIILVAPQEALGTVGDDSTEVCASYIVYQDGGTIKAKNSTTGKVQFEGTDADSVIQSAINQLTNGGKVLIKRGDYYIDNTITVKNRVSIAGEGGEATVLDPTANVSVFTIGAGTHGLTIEDLFLLDRSETGNPHSSEPAICIDNEEGNQTFITIRDLTIREFKGAIWFSNSAAHWSANFLIERVTADFLRDTGFRFNWLMDSELRCVSAHYNDSKVDWALAFHFKQTGGIEAFDLRAGGCPGNLYDRGYHFDDQILSDDPGKPGLARGRSEFHNLNCDDPYWDCVYIGKGNEVNIFGGNMALWGHTSGPAKGIYVDGNSEDLRSRICVRGVYFYDNSEGPCVLLEYAQSCIVEGIHLKSGDAQQWGIQETGTSNYNIIVANYVRGSQGISTVGGSTIVANNQ